MARGIKREVPVIDASPEDWAYLAGIIDGEGCIGTIRTTSNGRMRPVLSIKQKYPTVLNRLVLSFGGWITDRTNPPGYLWRLTSGRAEAVIEGALPYLTLKERQARVALRLFYEYDLEESKRLARILSTLKRIPPEEVDRRLSGSRRKRS